MAERERRLPSGEIEISHWDATLQSLVGVVWKDHPFQYNEEIFEDPVSHCKLCGGTGAVHKTYEGQQS